MVVIELTYIKDFPEVDTFLEQYIQFLDKYYEQGFFIASGRKVPRDGGVILALVDKARAEKIIKDDPFYREGIAEYRFVEFELSKYDLRLEGLC